MPEVTKDGGLQEVQEVYTLAWAGAGSRVMLMLL